MDAMHVVRVRARAVLAMLFLAVTANAFAQGAGNSTVSGTIVDNTGVVPGAVVTLTELATKVVRTNTTNETGVFRFAALRPGQYSLKVELQGFKPVSVDTFIVDAGAIRDLGKLTLSAGNLSETVDVKAEVTPVQVTSSARMSSVTADQLANIQMKGRDIYGLLAVVPGVQDSNLSRDFTSWTSANSITINGAPVTSNNIMIDGIAQRDEYGTNAFVNPNIDAVGEVQVVASGYTAENGRSNGGLVNYVTKSGTNRFRGSGWYTAKRDAWVANDYVRERNNQAKPLYRVNIGGFSIGGPVVIPKVIDSRSSEHKFFFFGSQEFTKDARPTQTVTANYPTDLERIGDFSQTRLTTAANYGAIQPIIDYKTGQPFPNNIIPPDRINTIGQQLLNLLIKPNGYVPPGANQQFNANFIGNETPEHNRIDYVYRMDVAWNNKWRLNYKVLADQENNIRVNEFGPGVGKSNNTVPAWQSSGTVTTVINPTLVNELNGGFTINHYNQRGYPNDYDYKQYYCTTVGVCPPRIAPYGTYYGYNDPPQNASCSGSIDEKQLDQYPYLPVFTTAGGNRTGLAGFSPAVTNGRVMPTCNHDRRWVFQDDLTKTSGHHTFKTGVYWENDETHAPVSGVNYMGTFNFGSSAGTNPLDSGNGYANMLLGVITQYSEVTNRIAWNIGHSEFDAYAQDNWRVNSRLTLDYGLRATHYPSWYETNQMTAAFYPELYDASKAVRLYRPVCTNGSAGNVACPAASQASIDPANPGVFLPFQLAGTVVPNSGVLTNGIKADGRDSNGSYYDYNNLFWGPRIGMAWDVRGNHKEAVRASFGLFYDFPRGGNSAYIGVPPVSFNQVVNNLTMDQLASFTTGGSLTFSQNPVGAPAATVAGDRHSLPTSYQVNVAYQRDVGFSTTVEAAYVGNFTHNDRRTYNLDVLPLYVFADPKNQFNQAALSQNYLFTKYPGMANITDFTNDLETLRYHSLQLSVQRRLSRGLQMGLAYTLSKGMGMQGWDPYTADPSQTINMGGTMMQGGPDALKARYWGPTPVDRRHNLTVNYSYAVPTLKQDNKVVRELLSHWQFSGVTKLLSGTATSPTCSNTTTRGVQFSLPSYTNTITSRCNLTGAPINDGVRVDPDPAHPDLLTAQYFNLAAFTMATPQSATVGDFGNAPLGLLHNPTVSEWDLTIERRFPVGQRGGVRFMVQVYNLFNQIQWTTMNTALTFNGTANVQSSTTAGQYGTVINPRQMGLTVRFDF